MPQSTAENTNESARELTSQAATKIESKENEQEQAASLSSSPVAVKAHILCGCFPLQVTDSVLSSPIPSGQQMLPSFSTVLRSPAYLTPRFLTRAVSSSTTVAPPGMEPSYKFGPYKIDAGEVFHATPLSYAMVNLRPLLPGHVLVCPKREVKRFADLSSDETSDLWITAKEVGARLEQYHKASSLTFAIQDGPQAGQTVPHVHIHVMPRRAGDFEKNDEIYDAIDLKEKELKEKLDLDIERKDRTVEEMAHEANEYRALFS